MHWTLWLLLPLLWILLLASPRWAWWKASVLSLLMLALSSWWMIDRLSGDGINAATLYHLRTDMEGAGVADFSGYIASFAGLVLLSLSPLLPIALRPRRASQTGNKVFAAFLALTVTTLLVSPLARDARRVYQQLQPVDYQVVADQYVVPTHPLAQRKNIVWIYGESLERTYLNEQVFPGLMPNLQRLAGEALDIRGVDSADGTGWTIAGLVASMCGVPLTTARGDENSLGRLQRFLPEAFCLGDYLKKQGYATHYLGGANGQFAAKAQFLASHGFDQVDDLGWFQQQAIARKHFSNWGIHDDVLLEEAWQRFLTLSRQDTPFMLTALTMDTHHPAGHLPVACKRTRYRSEHGNIGLLNALQCTDRLISRLVDRIRASEFAANTVVVVASDHLAMPNHLSHVLQTQQRENLLLFLGTEIAPRQLTTGTGSTLDSGATLLHLLSPQLNALGFGRSLLDPPARDSASAAARLGTEGMYPRYLAFARSLWLGEPPRVIRLEDDHVVVGQQRVQPPVMLEYDARWQLTSLSLEDTARKFEQAAPAQRIAYVDRCTAFEDVSARGQWCALLQHGQGMQLFRDEQLRRGVAVDATLPPATSPLANVRQSRMISRGAQATDAGRYLLELHTRQTPDRPFWVEAVSRQRTVVLARQWVQPDADGRIRMPLGLDDKVDDLEIRAWLNHAEQLAIDDYALLPQRPLSGRS